VVCNFTPTPHPKYRIGVPKHGFYQEILNSDATIYGGSGMGNLGGKYSDQSYYSHNQPHSLEICIPPLATLVFKLKHN
jgi:1,4-alpha-glucan branching enzyme